MGRQPGRRSSGSPATSRTTTCSALLEARDPVSGTPLGQPFNDRTLNDGRVDRRPSPASTRPSPRPSRSACSGRSPRTSDSSHAHDVAVDCSARSPRTLRLDDADPQGQRARRSTPTPAASSSPSSDRPRHEPTTPTSTPTRVISNKVRTTDGRWLALDGAYLKKHPTDARRHLPVGAPQRTQPHRSASSGNRS